MPKNIADLPQLPGWPGEEPRQETQLNDPAIKVHLREWSDLENNRAQQPSPPRFYERIRDPGAAVGPDGLMRGIRDHGRLYSIKTGVHYVGSTYQGPPVANKHLLEANSTMAMLRSNVVRRLTNNDRIFGVQPEQFAVPVGRAKARLFLNYGLIHTSANAQNFVLGFPSLAAGRQLAQFVVRYLGDTSWLYCTRVEQSLLLPMGTLLNRAAFVRMRGPAIATSETRLRQAINAEELFVCVAIERLLRTDDDEARKAMRARLKRAFRGRWPAVVPRA